MKCFGGHDRVDPGAEHISHPEPWHERPCGMQVYVPNRTAVAYAPVT